MDITLLHISRHGIDVMTYAPGILVGRLMCYYGAVVLDPVARLQDGIHAYVILTVVVQR